MPEMRKMGWTNQKVVNFGSNQHVDDIGEADVVICSSKHYR
jgi:hypothetical protein